MVGLLLVLNFCKLFTMTVQFCHSLFEEYSILQKICDECVNCWCTASRIRYIVKIDSV